MSKKVLVIAAHPDDEVLGMGGTIAKLSENGAEIALLIVTDGSSSQYRDRLDLDRIVEEKKKETRGCCDVLGIKHLYYGGLPDMKLDSIPHIAVNEVIERVVREFEPDTVYTHFWGDVNKDHRCVYESTVVACRPVMGQCVKKLFAYSVPSSTEWNIQKSDTVFVSNWYEDISGRFAETKYKAFGCYGTELREYPHPRSVEYLKTSDALNGNQVGLMAAEKFILLRRVD